MTNSSSEYREKSIVTIFGIRQSCSTNDVENSFNSWPSFAFEFASNTLHTVSNYLSSYFLETIRSMISRAMSSWHSQLIMYLEICLECFCEWHRSDEAASHWLDTVEWPSSGKSTLEQRSSQFNQVDRDFMLSKHGSAMIAPSGIHLVNVSSI